MFGHSLKAFVLILALPSVCFGQQYGQWSWFGGARIRGVEGEYSSGESGGSNYSEQSIELALGIRGFILHPRICRFSLGLTTDRQKVGSTTSQILGGEGSFVLFPQGSYLTVVTFSHDTFDFTENQDESVASIISGLPSNVTTFKSHTWVQRGRFGGIQIDVKRHVLGYADSSRDQLRDEQYIEWDGGKRLRQHYHLERRAESLGQLGVESENLTGLFHQQVSWENDWLWQTNGVAIQSDYTSPSAKFDSTAGSLNTLGRYSQPLWDAEANYSGGLSRASGGLESDSHSAGIRYRSRHVVNTTITPSIRYTVQSSDGSSARTPQADCRVDWKWVGEAIRINVGSQVSVGQREVDRLDGMTSSKFTQVWLSASVSHYTKSRLRTSFSLEMSQNKLREAGVFDPSQPDLGVSLGLGLENAYKTAITAHKSWGYFGDLTAELQAERTEGEDDLLRRSFESDRVRLYLVVRWNQLRASATVAKRQLNSSNGRSRDYSVSGGVGWKPWPFLGLEADYASSNRQSPFAPDQLRKQIRASVVFAVGLFHLKSSLLKVESTLEGRDREERFVLQWTVSRRFGGLLPIVTGGHQRTGFIR